MLPLLVPAAALALDPRLAPRSYVRDRWTTDNGLPQNSVTSIVQTRDGYLWIGTFGGLTRFDGVRFAPSSEAGAPELSTARILSLREDRAGTLWIGTEENGIGRLRDGRLDLLGTAEGLLGQKVWTLHEDARGTLWAGTSRGLYSFDGRRFVSAALPPELGATPTVVSLAEDPAGRLWIGTFGGLALRSDAGVRMAHHGTGPALRVFALAPENDGSIWVRTPAALSRFKGGTRLQELKTEMSDAGVAAPVVRDRDGNLWFAGGDGLSRLNGDLVELLPIEEGLPHGRIRSLYEDREGGLWVGLDGGGLLRVRDANILVWDERDGLPRSILPITEDAAGTLWAGGSCGGLMRREGKRFREIMNRAGGTFGCVTALVAARDGALWVSSDRLRRLAGGEERAFGPADGLPDTEVLALLEDRDGTIWAGTRDGLARFRDGRFQMFDRSNAPTLDDVRALELDRDGALWIGSLGSVTRLRDGHFESWGAAEGIPKAAIRSFWQSGDGAMWAGTYGSGLLRIAGREVRRFGPAEGFLDNVVSRLLEDAQGDLWLSGLKGLARLPRGQLEDLGSGRLPAVTPTLYGVADGMRTAECNGGGSPAGWKSADGRLLFPTVHGIAVIDPSRMRRNALAPPVHIESTLVNGRAVAPAALAELPPGRPEIEIRYTALSFTTPDRVRFRYRLEGYNRDWVDAGTRRTAFYTNVPPGKYRFVVKAANGDGVWNETGASLAVALRPQIHQTAWFPILIAAAVAAAGAGAASWRLRHLRRRKRELENLVDDRTKELVALNANLEQRVAENTIEIRATRDMALFALARLAELRDSATAEHLERIGAYSRHLAHAARRSPRRVPIDDDFVEDLGRSSPLHDIGKVAIPDAILRKPGRLSADELAIMQTHTTIGGDTLREVLRSHRGPSFLEMAADIAYYHHERWDGSGYPKRLAGEEIPLAARIVALVDAYDALTSVRPYKPAFTHEDAVRRIVADRGSHFDPALVDVFTNLAGDFPEIRRAIDGEARAVN